MELNANINDERKNVAVSDGGTDNPVYEEEVEDNITTLTVPKSANGAFVDGTKRRVSYASDVTDPERKASSVVENNVKANDIDIDSAKQLLYKTGDNPPIHLLLFFGFQQALLSLSASLALVLIASKVICAADDEVFKSQLLSATLFMNGVSTLLMVTIGSRLPLYQGAYGGYIIPLLTLMQIDPDRCTVSVPATSDSLNVTGLNGSTAIPVSFDLTEAKHDLVMKYFREMQGCLMLVGLIHCLVGLTGLVGVLLRFIGPITIVPTILLLGIYVAEPTLDFAVVHWPITLMTCAIGFILAFYLAKWQMPIPVWSRNSGWRIIRYPLHQVYAILISIIISWIISLIITEAGGFTDDKTDKHYKARTDARLDAITNAHWFFFPYPGIYGPVSYNTIVFIGFLIATFISILDSIGDYYACAAISQVPPPPSHAVNRGIAVEGLCTLISGAVGCPQATTTYGANIGAIGVTKVASRSVFIVVAVIYIIFGVLGKLSAVFITIPYPVLGGSLIVMMGMVIGVVLSLLVSVDLSSTRNLAVIGCSIIMGLVIPLWIKKFPEDISTGNQEADFILKGLLGNPNFTGAVLACFLDNTIPGTLEERGIKAWQTDGETSSPANVKYVESVEEVYEFWMPQAIKNWRGWRFFPFMPSPARKRQRSLSQQWARRKSLVSDVMV